MEYPHETSPEIPTKKDLPKRSQTTDILVGLLLVAILGLAAYLRFTGINWDEFTHLHPDERFLTMVETSIKPPSSVGEYFNTDLSPLNPHNVGHGFFVYGTLPIFLVRFVAEWVGKTGYDEVQLVGRALSGVFDLISILLVYLIGERLYSRRVGVLAALFLSLSVLLIQHAHYFVVDPIANTFILAGLYFAVRVLDTGKLLDYALFGVILGMAVASKISAAPIAGVLVLAAGARFIQTPAEERQRAAFQTFAFLGAAAVLSLVVFRIFQPYAFSGPSIFGISLNPKWLGNMAEIRNQQGGNTDAPYALQWANRTPVLFSLRNMVIWGLGVPLGVLGWLGWAWALVQMVRGRWQRHLIPVVWTGAFFIWQSTGFTQAMRYQLPIYPTLALMASWGLWEAWDLAKRVARRWRRIVQVAVAVVGIGAVLLTLAWALAFQSIYTEPFTRAAASRWIYTNIPGIVNLVVDDGGETKLEVLPMPQDFLLEAGGSHIVQVNTNLEGEIRELTVPYLSLQEGESSDAEITFRLYHDPADLVPLATASFLGPLSAVEEIPLDLSFDRSVPVDSETTLFLKIDNTGNASIKLRGSVIVHETTWDDGLPWGIDGKGLGGRYGTRNLELYWPDEQDEDQNGISDKLERIADFFDEGDYLTISSNRQYGTIPRVPSRYPLTTAYYRALLGCPEPLDILKCAEDAQPGEIQGELGYSLFKVYESNPSLGPFEISDQRAEEAFTVYDHPKVLIFKKDDSFSRERVMELLSTVDAFEATHVLPKDVGEPPKDLLLSENRWEAQQQEGTWSELFSRDGLIHSSGILTAVLWWVTIGVIGILLYPITRVAFKGLSDGGFPLARLTALLLLAWGVWFLGSMGVKVTVLQILLVLLLLMAISFLFGYRDLEEIKRFFRENKREILIIEGIAIGFFLLDLIIRIGNPDLWHPAKGGEKPMDLAYLNAVLKSSTFPPYDPWFAGGYINYYYYGFVIVGIPVKLLGIPPTTAYNLIIPTLFSLLALGAYSVAYNLVAASKRSLKNWRISSPRLAGISAAIILVVLGNLGTARMFYEGFKQMGTTPGTETRTFVVGATQAARGVGEYLTRSDQMPYPLDQWYWNPSRVITPGEGEAGPITEFPFFTFLYGDLHAHMINRPITILALAWGIAWLFSAEKRKSRRWIDVAAALVVGGVVYGALRPTNTWDFPVYWVLGVAALLYAVWLRYRKLGWKQILEAVLSVAALIGLAQLLYQPYHISYGQGYVSADLWEGSLTPIMDYLTVHGLFLFVLISWMTLETRAWMEETPLTALMRFKPYMGLIGAGVLLFFAGVGLMLGLGYAVVLFVIPMGIWSVILLFRPGMRVGKQAALVMVGVGLALTFGVEIIVIRGDISRMNTVFKFYLEVWELFSLATGAAIAWLIADLPLWKPNTRRVWGLLLGILVFAAALYPLLASIAKIKDRMAPSAPATLDGMEFMPYVTNYGEVGEQIDFGEDYDAILWMQENIEGSPVIVEANVPEYRWGSRITNYTGLPAVLGWRWHQTQQRISAVNHGVDTRLFDITNFYLTQSVDEALEFLAAYNVKYIIVGGLERAYYDQVSPCRPDETGTGVTCDLRGWPMGMPTAFDVHPAECVPLEPDNESSALRCSPQGLIKFSLMEDMGLLKTVYKGGNTTIYEVVK